MEITNIKATNHVKEERSMNEYTMQHITYGPKHPMAPHERRGMITIQFDNKDWTVFKDVFGNDDEAAAAAGIIQSAPPEIQILVVQLLIQIEKEVA